MFYPPGEQNGGSDRGGMTGPLRGRFFFFFLKGFLLSCAPFRQGLNWSKIIAVMSNGNLPQTEAGSREAVAPGKAELLSFLKCQRGTGTGNTSALCCDFLLGADKLLS